MKVLRLTVTDDGLPLLNRSRRIDNHVHALIGLKGLLAGSVTQKVECGVVRYAE
jgi:hypothetical protein